jgi:hypothetical protein
MQHSSLLFVFCFHILTVICCSLHLSAVSIWPFPLLFYLLTYFQIFFVTLVWSTLMMWPNHSELFLLISPVRGGVLCSFLSSLLVMTLQNLFSVAGPYTFLRILLCYIFNLTFILLRCGPFFSDAYITNGFNITLNILRFCCSAQQFFSGFKTMLQTLIYQIHYLQELLSWFLEKFNFSLLWK